MAIKYQLIAEELRKQILSAKCLISYKLPTEKELCEKYRVSRQTIRQALYVLAEEKLITSRQGSGFYTIPLSEHLNENKIVMLISEENEYTYPQFLSQIQANLRNHRLSLTIYVTHNDINIERNILHNLEQESISILIVEGIQSAFENPNIDIYERLQFLGTKIIFISHHYPQLTNVLTVLSDNTTGGYLLGKHFIANGCHNFCAILPDSVQNAKERYAGLQMAYRDHQLPIPSNNIFWYSEEDLFTLRMRHDTSFLTAFIRNMALKYHSVFCYSDEISYWLIKELSYANISVPGQLAVASFDNSYLCTLSRPAITSLALPSDEPAASIANMVINILHDQTMENKMLPWEILSRGSTRANI